MRLDGFCVTDKVKKLKSYPVMGSSVWMTTINKSCQSSGLR